MVTLDVEHGEKIVMVEWCGLCVGKVGSERFCKGHGAVAVEGE